jgi:hypothetical protein
MASVVVIREIGGIYMAKEVLEEYELHVKKELEEWIQ